MKSLLLILLCIFPLALSAQSTTSAKTEIPKIIDNVQSQTGSSGQSEIPILKAQLDQMKFYDQRLLATVYWALAGLATIAVAIVGFGWFANFKVYERDKEILQTSLKQDLLSELTKLRDGVEEAVMNKVQEMHASQAGSINQLKRDLSWIKLGNCLQAAQKYEAEGIYTNVVRSLSEGLEIALKIGYGWKIADILDDLNRILNKVQKNNASSPDANLTRELMAILNDVPPTYQIILDSIRERLAQLHRR